MQASELRISETYISKFESTKTKIFKPILQLIENEKIENINHLSSCTEIDSFNFFTYLSDSKYWKETYNSKLLSYIFSPDIKWGNIQDSKSGIKYLNIFMDAICQKKTMSGKPIEKFAFSENEPVSVNLEYPVKEGDLKGAIDIFICQDKDCIIIENKINNAVDQENQLEKYWNIIQKDFNIIAIIYIPLNKNKKPKDKLIDEIKNKTVIFPANELAEQFLDKCIESCSGSGDDYIFLTHYSRLVKHLGGSSMVDELKKQFLMDICSKTENFIAAQTIADVWNNKEELLCDILSTDLKAEYKRDEGSKAKSGWHLEREIPGMGCIYCYPSSWICIYPVNKFDKTLQEKIKNEIDNLIKKNNYQYYFGKFESNSWGIEISFHPDKFDKSINLIDFVKTIFKKFELSLRKLNSI